MCGEGKPVTNCQNEIKTSKQTEVVRKRLKQIENIFNLISESQTIVILFHFTEICYFALFIGNGRLKNFGRQTRPTTCKTHHLCTVAVLLTNREK